MEYVLMLGGLALFSVLMFFIGKPWLKKRPFLIGLGLAVTLTAVISGIGLMS